MRSVPLPVRKQNITDDPLEDGHLSNPLSGAISGAVGDLSGKAPVVSGDIHSSPPTSVPGAMFVVPSMIASLFNK